MKRQVVISLILGIIIFILGIGAGVFYQNIKVALQLGKCQKLDSAAKALSSKLVLSVVASGKASNVNGREFSLNSGGQSLKVLISDNAEIFAIRNGVDRTAVNLSDIRNGNTVTVIATMTMEGVLVASAVNVL